MAYIASDKRYDNMEYRYAGNTGLKLPNLSLGLWFNFGSSCNFENCDNLVKTAFDNGITHFDLANNYGPPRGSAEEMFGDILKKGFKEYRDECIISTKAGYGMWQGPYGDFGSRKYLIASLNQSLKRMGLDYVDIFYSHRFDPNTPLEETMMALDSMVRQGKALYVGISNYNAEQTEKAVDILKELKTPYVLNQLKHSMFNREHEDSTFKACSDNGMGVITYSSLAQGLLTNKYLDGIPEDSRYKKFDSSLRGMFTEENIEKIKKLNQLAVNRNQKLNQLALQWVLENEYVTSTIIGASSPNQITDNLEILKQNKLSKEENKLIESILK